ncbi:energy-coupling factor transporter transmembrane component T family protein [Enterococcus sp. CSURQ0835]|uniref:energy-coupling factor transporter transmembrane component T family protein n=1 Tax=Enterococcus sp. CSURQ0835 TaxID=2681394 RepID=UPI001356C22B|nr:energy-coupling factor transporter transmembrane component T [Enterococcus sp. CSURQ0835]
MKKLNPTIKFGGILLTGLLVSFQNNLRLNLTLAVIFAVVSILYLSFKQWLQLTVLLTVTAIGVFFSGYFFLQAKSGQAVIGDLTVTPQVLYGLKLATRIYCFGFLGSSFAATTTLPAFIYSAQQQLRLPAQFAYGMMAAFHMLPLIKKEYQNTRISLRSRGLTAGFISPKLLTPLLVKSIRWSETLAQAMESRGFSGTANRTYFYDYQIRFQDGLFLVGLLGLAVALSF